MRRILAFILSVAMVLAFTAVGFAVDSPTINGDRDTTGTADTAPTEGTSTTTLSDGTVVETTTEADGTVTTETTESDGDVTITVELPASVDDSAAPVLLDKVDGSETEDAVSIKITAPVRAGKVAVELPVDNADDTFVAVDEDGNVIDCYVGENGVVLNVEGTVTFTVESKKNAFTDTNTAFSKRVADFSAARGITVGTSATTFSPKAPMTVGDTTRVINRLTGGNAAVEDTTVPATRSAMIVALYKAYGSPAVDADLSAFGDLGDATEEELAAVKWAVANKIIFGTTTTTMDLTGSANREQFFTMVMRAYKMNLLSK